MITVSDIKVGDLLFVSHELFHRVVEITEGYDNSDRKIRTLKYEDGAFSRSRPHYQFMTLEDMNDHKL